VGEGFRGNFIPHRNRSVHLKGAGKMMPKTSPATRILPLRAAFWTSHQLARNFYPRTRASWLTLSNAPKECHSERMSPAQQCDRSEEPRRCWLHRRSVDLLDSSLRSASFRMTSFFDSVCVCSSEGPLRVGPLHTAGKRIRRGAPGPRRRRCDGPHGSAAC
jgi:hypothetical protein